MQARHDDATIPAGSEITVLEPGFTDSINPFRHADRVVLRDGEEIGRMGTRRGRAIAWAGFRRYELRRAGDVTLGEFLGDFLGHFSGRRARMRWHSAGGKRIDMGRDAESWQRPQGWLDGEEARLEVASRLEANAGPRHSPDVLDTARCQRRRGERRRRWWWRRRRGLLSAWTAEAPRSAVRPPLSR